MKPWQSLTQALGRWPARRVTWLLVLVFSLWAVADGFVLQVSSGLSRSTYDAMVRARLYAAPPDTRIVIVDIDEASLARMGAEFGRWPWPRDTLATVLDFIEQQSPAAIAWDIGFSDADKLSPGGDKAFDEAAKRSVHSVFSVVRLPAANDAQSQLARSSLPGLWLPPAPTRHATLTLTLAAIPPVLPALAAGPLGLNNGTPDADGVLRRYRYAEPLADGSAIQSLALAVARLVNGEVSLAAGATKKIAANAQNTGLVGVFGYEHGLLAWRAKADMYPRVPFADVFAKAEGGTPRQALPSFAGKVVLVGSTAPSLHDMHPTPLAPLQQGVDSLATATDNALHQRHLAELPRSLQALLAVALCLGVAAWVQRRGIASLDAALLLLPGALLGLSYLSLHGAPVFVDLNLSASIALLFLSALRIWNGWRRSHWCSLPPGWGEAAPEAATQAAYALLPLHAPEALANAALDHLMDALEAQAPDCRLVCADAQVSWPGRLHWPEIAQYAAVLGPAVQLLRLQQALAQETAQAPAPRLRSAPLQSLPTPCSRAELVRLALAASQQFPRFDSTGDPQ